VSGGFSFVLFNRNNKMNNDNAPTNVNSLPAVQYTDDLQPGRRFGDVYILVRKLGKGGMGECWQAEEYSTPNRDGRSRSVVIKIVPTDVQNAEDEMERVEDVFYATEKLSHPNICPVYALKRDEFYGHYLVMRYIDGKPLNKYRRELRQQNRITLDEAVKLFRPLAEGLDYAHRNKVIHRDIKPANVMVEGGIPFLIDFGLAAQIRTSVTRVSKAVTSKSGTLCYMSPEQWEGEPQKEQTDQYSLGVMVYEFLSGDVPFLSDNNDIMYRLVTQKAMPLLEGFPASVNAALARALAKERKERFASCVEFINSLTAKPQVVVLPPIQPPPVHVPPRQAADANKNTQQAGERILVAIENLQIPFRWCPAGTFQMGSPSSEKDRSDNETQHQVTLTQGFWMGETAVTQEMWQSVMGANPSRFKGAKNPVEQVSWDDCQKFIGKLNGLGVAPSGFKFSLPTEAQWEYACRAGTTTPFSFGGVLNGDQANCDGNDPYGTGTKGKYLKKTTEVGSYPANAWGLYDMHGNVWEWCSDWYGDYPVRHVTDPLGASSGSDRVNRGGSWNCFARYCRSADRCRLTPDYRLNFLGFRLSLVLR
jgi:formylglycine-generating enzyme required for sulfatase activity